MFIFPFFPACSQITFVDLTCAWWVSFLQVPFGTLRGNPIIAALRTLSCRGIGVALKGRVETFGTLAAQWAAVYNA